MHTSGGTSVARAFAGRTAADFDWPRADGQAACFDPGRALRRTRPCRARAFPAISPAARQNPKAPYPRAGDASRGRNHAGLFARIDFEERESAGVREKVGDVDGGKSVARFWDEIEIAGQGGTVWDECFAEKNGGGV